MAFVAVLIAFTLPLGIVSSCGEEQARFTGVQLATFEVAPTDESTRDVAEKVEHHAGPFALAALAAAAIGALLVVLGLRGAAACAALGVVAMQLLVYGIVSVADDGRLRGGYWLALLAFGVAATAWLASSIDARRRASRSVRPPIGAAVAVVLPPLGAIAVGVVWLSGVLVRAARRLGDPSAAT